MSALDNPLWNSLITRHFVYAIGSGLARRYPSEIAPFAGIGSPSPQADKALLDLFASGEHVGMVGVHPRTFEGWEVAKSFDLAQFVFEGSAAPGEDDRDIVKLGPDDLEKMLELTALVYPAYFRKGTAQLGDYFGISVNGRLTAMAGTRMSLDGYQEISAVCTHPDHRGEGRASQLLAHLVQHILNQGDTPFLHTEADNVAAQGIYRRAGFSVRKMLPFIVLRRA